MTATVPALPGSSSPATGEAINVRDDFGALADGVTDDTAAIQAAIDAVPSAGGTVYLPVGIYVVNGTISLTDRQNVRLVGGGAQAGNYFGAPTKGTVLKRVSGTGKMLVWSATPTTGSALRGCGIEGIAFDGGILATHCVELGAHYGGVYRDLFLHGATSVGLNLLGVDVSDIDTLQGCLFENLFVSVVNSVGAKALSVGGDPAAVSVSANVFINVVVHVASPTETGIEFGTSDSNIMLGVGSTGVIKFLASNNPSRFCNGNNLYDVQAAGITSQGTPTATYAAAGNRVLFNSENYRDLRPVIEAGSTLHFSDTRTGYTLPQYRGLAEIKDEFLGGAPGVAIYGELTWVQAGGGTITIPSAAGHPGLVRISTTAASGTYAGLGLGVHGSPTMIVDDQFDITFVGRLNTNDSNTQIRLGLFLNFADGVSDGIYFEKLFADTSWFGVVRKASVDVRTAALASVSTNWVVLRFRKTPGGTDSHGFSVDGSAEVLNTGPRPSAALQPTISIKNNAASAKTFDIDYFNWSISGLNRA